MRLAAAASIAVAALAAGCGSGARTPAAAGPHVPAAACKRGAPPCMDAVVADMQARFDALAAACDHRAAFALMYLRVTQAVRRETGGAATDADGAYLVQLDAAFAGLYFKAFDEWASGDRSRVPQAWRLAFETAERKRVSGVGDLLLGMNAHISRDLPFAVASVGLGTGAAAERRRQTFSSVNTILRDVADGMLREESRRFDPTIEHFTLPVLKTDSASLALLLGRWRDGALRDGERLLDAPTAAKRAAVARSIERTALARAVVIAAATSRVPFSHAGRARDAFCRGR